jgi:two-component system, LytTR family, response regulator
MKVLIVEDEKLSAGRLSQMLQKLVPGVQILKITDSVSTTIEYLQTHPPIDVGFFDIQLADGLSFAVFEQIRVPFPVIFTTAFNEYTIQAFKVNSIDYLLKPVDEKSLSHALKQYRESKAFNNTLSDQAVAKALGMLTREYKSRFLVKIGEHLRVITIEEVALFYALEKTVFIKTFQDRNYPIDFSLDQLAELLDPERFFRVNRKHILAMNAITDIIVYSGSRFKLKLTVPVDEDILVSRERVAEFKEWLDDSRSKI